MRRCLIALAVGAMLLAACGQRPGTHAVRAAAPVAAVTPTTSPSAAPTEAPAAAAAATPAPTTAAAPEPTEAEVTAAEPSPASDDDTGSPPGDQASEPKSEPEPEPAPETGEPRSTTTDPGAPLWDRSFRSRRVTQDGREREWAEGTSLEVDFARHRPKGDPNPDDSLNWYAGCNWTSSGLRVKPEQLIVSGGYSTAIGCNEPYAEQDDWVRRFLHSDPRWVLDGNTLTLTSGDTTIVFREIPPEDRERPGDD